MSSPRVRLTAEHVERYCDEHAKGIEAAALRWKAEPWQRVKADPTAFEQGLVLEHPNDHGKLRDRITDKYFLFEATALSDLEVNILAAVHHPASASAGLRLPTSLDAIPTEGDRVLGPLGPVRTPLSAYSCSR